MKSKYNQDEITKFLCEKYGRSIALRPVVEGMESQVFSFEYAGDEFIIRINPAIEGFRKDDYAYRNFSSKKTPIPRIFEYGHFNAEHAFCISEKAPGITFEDADEATVTAMVNDEIELWLSIGEINISDTTGYGIFSSEDGNAPFNSWRDYLLSILDENVYDWKKVRTTQGVDIALLERLKSAFLALVEYCPEERKLRHGDFGTNNLLIDASERKITAVIDWDNASYGDMFYDIGGTYFWSTWLMCEEITAKHMEERFRAAPNYRERTLCYQMHLGLSEIYENALDGDIETLQWCQERCRQILRLSN